MLTDFLPTIDGHCRVFSPLPVPRTMQAAVIAAPGQVRIEEVAVPEPGPGEVLVQIEGCGVCASNLPVWEGRPWFDYPLPAGQPGHEGWGWVVGLGKNVEKVSLGERVALLSYNAYAEYDVATEDAVATLPLSLEDLPFPGEALGCAINVIQRSQIERGQKVAVVGIGFLGALLTQLAAAAGAEVFALSRRQYALDIAKSCGAAHTFSIEQEWWQIVDEMKKLTRDQLCDVVIECVGKQGPLDLASRLTTVRGRLVIAGYHQDGLRQVNMQSWNWQGLDVINAHERDPRRYQEGMQLAVEATVKGTMNPSPLCTHLFGLSELGDALTLMQQRPDGFLKALIMM
jgi:threonine dehydrogenase-like Zn-dependent dehydrogenase